jgi:hypothetical protein
MAELQLTRSADDRRLYALGELGTLRLDGLMKRAATAEAGDRRWLMERSGMFKSSIVATDPAGVVAGEFDARTFKRGGTLTWAGRDLALEPDSFWKQRYALLDGDRTLATIEGRTGGKRPIDLSVDDPTTIDPGLLLFAAFVVHCLARDAQAASSSSSSAGM